jgi:hypothetical protein
MLTFCAPGIFEQDCSRMDIDVEHIISPTRKLAILARLREMNHFVEARRPGNGIEGLGEVRGDWRSRRERRTRPNDAINVVFGRQVGDKSCANISARSCDENALACHNRTLMSIGTYRNPPFYGEIPSWGWGTCIALLIGERPTIEGIPTIIEGIFMTRTDLLRLCRSTAVRICTRGTFDQGTPAGSALQSDCDRGPCPEATPRVMTLGA